MHLFWTRNTLAILLGRSSLPYHQINSLTKTKISILSTYNKLLQVFSTANFDKSESKVLTEIGGTVITPCCNKEVKKEKEKKKVGWRNNSLNVKASQQKAEEMALSKTTIVFPYAHKAVVSQNTIKSICQASTLTAIEFS